MEGIAGERLNFLMNFNPVALVSIVTTGLILLCVPVFIIFRKFKLISRINKIIFWNTLIRLLQGAFIP